jgi:hypothetical protein
VKPACKAKGYWYAKHRAKAALNHHFCFLRLKVAKKKKEKVVLRHSESAGTSVGAAALGRLILPVATVAVG